ncbi:hypothetical protein Leryth_013427 [Lithospermum erythrorhizon]|nr:hypothetical protein Leryth_013427 [Lithospermum erythrorhizon]
MASSKVMVSTAPTNPDLPRYVRNHNSSSAFSTHFPNSVMFPSTHQLNGSLGSMNMEDVLNTMYSEPTDIDEGGGFDGGGGGSGCGGVSGGVCGGCSEVVVVEGVGGSGVGEIGNGGQSVVGGENNEAMTLETYLKKAGAVTEEDIRVPGGVVEVAGATTGNYGMEGLMNYGMQNCPSGGVCVGGGRGKRRAVEEVPLDKATQQKQKRMIKNRESAARSRERKQAYTVELEALVTKLEEENARLIKEEAELKKQRLKQLIEKVKPVVEERRPPKAVMRRARSMTW